MKITEFKNRVSSLISFIGFEYEGKSCGIDPINKSHFEMWCGDNYIVAKSIDEVMNTKIFNGHSLSEIYPQITNLDY